MRGWLKRWYGRTASNELSEHDEEQMRELEAATGPGFEVRFLAMMSVHHTQAVERALAVRASRLHPATRRLTGAIIRTQEREIAQFQKFLVDFYAN